MVTSAWTGQKVSRDRERGIGSGPEMVTVESAGDPLAGNENALITAYCVHRSPLFLGLSSRHEHAPNRLNPGKRPNALRAFPAL